MTLSPKLWGVAAGGALSIALIGYFFWRPSQAPLPISPIQEQVISDLEAANEKTAKERESLKRQAQEAQDKATQAQTEAARVRGRLRELEALNSQIRAKGVFVTTEAEALKSLKAMGWVR